MTDTLPQTDVLLKKERDIATFYEPEFPQKKEFSVDSVLGPDGLLCKKIKNFKPRRGQLDMAQGVKEALKNGELLVSEAGTGTGKTYAYLIPALLSHRTVVISTASKALQDQLLHKDLPALYRYFGWIPDYMVLKGFSNYLCKKRFYDFQGKYGSTDLGFEDEADLKGQELQYRRLCQQVEKLMQSTDAKIDADDPACDYAEVNSRFSADFLREITISSELCRSDKLCPYRDKCYPLLARLKAISSRVVVINHALFFADMNIEDVFDAAAVRFMLPRYQAIVFDEAHELPEIGRNFCSRHFSTKLADELHDDLEFIFKHTQVEIKSNLLDACSLVNDAFAQMNRYLHANFKEDKVNFLALKYYDYDPNESSIDRIYTRENTDFTGLARKIYKALKQFIAVVKDNEAYDEEAFGPLGVKLSDLCDTLTHLMCIDKKDSVIYRRDSGLKYGDFVGSAEITRHGFEFTLSPLEIAEMFGGFLKKCREHELGVIMTSATLSVREKFSKFLCDLGAPENTKTLLIKSHFDYTGHAGLYLSDSFPESGAVQREKDIIDHLYPLIDATDGGVFILTTSIAALQRIKETLEERYKGKREIFVQNGTLSNTKMIQKFVKNGKAILAGTQSFWAGVDIPGKALRLVIIDKLPFSVPNDPLFKARCDRYDASHDRVNAHFMGISVPEAVITLRQGVGRLIRNENDTGATVICDPRLVKSSYRANFIDSLPPMKRCSSLTELMKFVKDI